MVFAAAHPDRVESLVLLGGHARLLRGAGYPGGVEQAHVDQITGLILEQWGAGDDLAVTNPSKARDEEFRRWYARIQRMSASPATAAAMARQWFEVDVRSVLPAIKMPTLVMARATNVIYPAQHTRYLAEHIAGAKYIEFPDTDLLYFAGNAGGVLDAIEEFVTGMRPQPSPDQFLGTVLFVDVVGSTQLAAKIGDSPFRELIDGFHQLVQRQLERYQGRLVDTAGDGALTLFDSPARAIACAEAVRDGVRALGLNVRAGLHTGEMEQAPPVRSGALPCTPGRGSPPWPARARSTSPAPSATWSRAPPIRLESRGVHELKGVPGSWEVFAVAS